MKILILMFAMAALAAEPDSAFITSGLLFTEPPQPTNLAAVNIKGRNILEFNFDSYTKATNDHPDVKFQVAEIYSTTTTNVTMEKVVDMSYGCAVANCTGDHSVTYWKQRTTIQREKIAELTGQKLSMGVEVLSLAVTNFAPVTTATGMVFQATAVQPWPSVIIDQDLLGTLHFNSALTK